MTATLEVIPLPMLSDNYAWALIDRPGARFAVVDPPEAAPVEKLLAEGLKLELILLTHHHADHVAAADGLRAATGAQIIGAAADVHRLPRLDHRVKAGDRIEFAGQQAEVFETPGHTIGHIAFHFAGLSALFCGDTLFSLGCGKLLEGTAQQMFTSLAQFKALPPNTLVYCGHEYTLSNGRFAQTVEPDNQALAARIEQAQAQRAAGEPTIPSLLGDELAANPFLRAANVAELAERRAAKDQFRG
jgi:hydroxyacylglutathione hydrolase